MTLFNIRVSQLLNFLGMEDKSNISIFRGSAVEADTVHDFLEQQNIGSLVRNHMQENLGAGWVTAAPEHAAEVFVAKEDESRALDLLRNIFHEEGTSSEQHAARETPSGVTPVIPAIIVTPSTPSPAEERRQGTPPPNQPLP